MYNSVLHAVNYNTCYVHIEHNQAQFRKQPIWHSQTENCLE